MTKTRTLLLLLCGTLPASVSGQTVPAEMRDWKLVTTTDPMTDERSAHLTFDTYPDRLLGREIPMVTEFRDQLRIALWCGPYLGEPSSVIRSSITFRDHTYGDTVRVETRFDRRPMRTEFMWAWLEITGTGFAIPLFSDSAMLHASGIRYINLEDMVSSERLLIRTLRGLYRVPLVGFKEKLTDLKAWCGISLAAAPSLSEPDPSRRGWRRSPRLLPPRSPAHTPAPSLSYRASRLATAPGPGAKPGHTRYRRQLGIARIPRHADHRFRAMPITRA